MSSFDLALEEVDSVILKFFCIHVFIDFQDS